MTPYQLLLAAILVLWPIAIFGMLFLMSRLENYVNRSEARTPEEAGLEPVTGRSGEREVQIRFGDKIVGEPKRRGARSSRPPEAAAPESEAG